MTHVWKNAVNILRRNHKRVGVNIFLPLLLTLLMLLPEWIFSQAYIGFDPIWAAKTLLATYLVNYLILHSYYRRLALALIGFLFFLQLTELFHYRYFGSFYSPTSIALLFTDFDEIFSSLGGVLQFIVVPLLVIGFTLTQYVIIHRKSHSQALRSRTLSALLLTVLLVPVINVTIFSDNPKKYDSNPTNFAIWNGVYSFSYFMGAELPERIRDNYSMNKYLPYKTTSIARTEKYHIVLVMGESLTSTHMSLFNYERQTTPYLDQMNKNGKLIYRQGVSSAIATRVSIPMFMNVQYEPDNWLHIASKETSLFNLAKQAGFQTAFLSGQTLDGISSLMTSRAIDHWRDQRDKGDFQYDDCLIEFMKQIDLDWSKPSFIVLNQRSAHSPYQDDFPVDFAMYSSSRSNNYKQITIDRYDDAVRYIDHNLKQIHDYLQAISPLPVILVVTSDHGEKLGENGLFGHMTLDILTAYVPLLIFSEHVPGNVKDLANHLPPFVAHYDMAVFIAQLLGYNIQDPNRKEGQYYINGTDLMGRDGFISYRINDLQKYLPQTPKTLASKSQLQ